MPRCIALRGMHRVSTAKDQRCKARGTRYISIGRFVCAQHLTHGYVPADLGESDQQSTPDDEQLARAARVIGDE